MGTMFQTSQSPRRDGWDGSERMLGPVRVAALGDDHWQALTLLPMFIFRGRVSLALIWKFSCLNLLSAGNVGVSHYTLLLFLNTFF
jgi:hypothetical protein